MSSPNLHYHYEHDAWRRVPPGEWMQDGNFWARRAPEDDRGIIYDIAVEMTDATIYFWLNNDWEAQTDEKYDNVEDAKAVAPVLLRLKQATD